MKVVGLAGWSGAGKTTLLTRLIPHLRAQGLTVSTIKHAHHAFDVDVPGKDSWRHREAGATEVAAKVGHGAPAFTHSTSASISAGFSRPPLGILSVSRV